MGEALFRRLGGEMAAVRWSQVVHYVEKAHVASGFVERGQLLEIAHQDGASDDVIRVLEALGTWAFATLEDARAFLQALRLVEKE